jgi:hypothetical protein
MELLPHLLEGTHLTLVANTMDEVYGPPKSPFEECCRKLKVQVMANMMAAGDGFGAEDEVVEVDEEREAAWRQEVARFGEV